MINLLIVCDNNYIQHACCMMDSVLSVTSDAVSVFLVYDNISPANLSKFSSYLSGRQVPLWTKQISMSGYENQLPVGAHFSLAGYLKIFAIEQLPVSKVLYIDPDVIALSDITELWQVDLGPNMLAAVEEYIDDLSYLQGFARIPYFNSGVMLINVDGIKQFGLAKRFRCLTPAQTSLFRYIDQDAMNLLLKDRWLALPPCWNRLPSLARQCASGQLKTISFADCQNAVVKPRLIHFAGGHKPWLYMSEMPYKQNYWRALSNTPWKNFRSPDRSFYNCFVKFRRRFMGNAFRIWLKGAEKKIKQLLINKNYVD